MKKLLTILLVMCSVIGFAQMRGGSQYDPGAARANLTNITSGSALGVDHGGTSATTAAAGLAALGGASLNGSSTVAFNASTINGVTPLTADEKTQALVGSATVNFLAQKIATVIPATNSLGTYAGSFQNLSAVNSSQHGIYGSVAGGGGNLINLLASGTVRFRIENNGAVTLLVSSVYADNAAAISAGLTAGMLYRTTTGVLMIVY